MFKRITILLFVLTILLCPGFDCSCDNDEMQQQLTASREQARRESERAKQYEAQHRRLLRQAEVQRRNFQARIAVEETRRSWYAAYTLVVAGVLCACLFILGRLYQTRSALIRILNRVLQGQGRADHEDRG